MSRPHRRLMIAVSLLMATCLARAADTSPSAPDKLSAAREQISAKKWAAAVDELKRVNDPAHADRNNLMGYKPAQERQAGLRWRREVLRRSAAHRAATPRRAGILGRALPNHRQPAQGRGSACRTRQGLPSAVRGIHRLEEIGRALQGERQQGRQQVGRGPSVRTGGRRAGGGALAVVCLRLALDVGRVQPGAWPLRFVGSRQPGAGGGEQQCAHQRGGHGGPGQRFPQSRVRDDHGVVEGMQVPSPTTLAARGAHFHPQSWGTRGRSCDAMTTKFPK